VARRIRRIEQAAEGGTWTADAWAVERVDPDTWGAAIGWTCVAQ
jgi:hypothetical protein